MVMRLCLLMKVRLICIAIGMTYADVQTLASEYNTFQQNVDPNTIYQ